MRATSVLLVACTLASGCRCGARERDARSAAPASAAASPVSAPAAAPAPRPQGPCPDELRGADDALAVVRTCERAVEAASGPDRAKLLLALGHLHAGAEQALCGAGGYGPARGERCDAFAAFAQAAPERYRRRTCLPGWEVTGHAYREIVEHHADAPQAAAARAELEKLAARDAAGCPPDAAAHRLELLVDACPAPVPWRHRPVVELAVCDGAVEWATETDLPALLLAQGIAHAVGFRYEACFAPGQSGYRCDEVDAYRTQHARLYATAPDGGGRRWRYTGWHFHEILKRWPDSPQAADARCELARMRGGEGWDSPECRAVLARVAPGPCPDAPPEGCEVVRVAAGCEASAARAPEEKRAALLLAAGRLFREAVRRDSCDEFFDVGVRRDDLYWYSELAGELVYSGKHFQEVLKRWPASVEADDAAWELATEYEGGECGQTVDEQLACGALSTLERYVARFPRGRHVQDAVDAAVEDLDQRLPRDAATNDWDPEAGPKVLQRFEEVAAKLAPEQATRIRESLEPWTKWLAARSAKGNAPRDEESGEGSPAAR